ncbi:MAG: glycosyltransferase [Candidatus Delongbacteria bacterium]|nr:glycosyltransferase [Candidatus Delongbacteria bacterium]
MLAPIILFVYNRPDHTIKTLNALKRNILANDSILYIFSDAPKNDNNIDSVNKVREILKSADGFKNIHISYAEQNKGLAKSIIEGVSYVINRHKAAIILEDDLISSNNFLQYMNNALSYYEKDQKIFQISGYSPHFNLRKDLDSDIFACHRISSWGWATWEDRWNSIDWKLKDLKEFLSSENIQKFSLGGKDKISVLIGAKEGINDVWAIKYDYGRFKWNNALVVYPKISKISNIGSDGSGVHKDTRSKFDVKIDESGKKKFNFSIPFETISEFDDQFEDFFPINPLKKFITLNSYRLGIYKLLKHLFK